LRRKIRPKKKMGQVLQLKMESRKLLRFEMKKSITHLLPPNFEPSRSHLRSVALRFCAALRHCTLATGKLISQATTHRI
jgi:hypothetical protein